MILLVLFLLCLLFLCYGVLPTLIIRIFSIKILKRGRMKQAISLTFDDGPHPVYTAELLDLLSKYRARATFFVVGERAQRYPELVQRMINEGHEVGIHHQTHSNSWLLSPKKLRSEIENCASAIQKITGRMPQYYRPPWGRFNLVTLSVARRYENIMWSSINADWKASQGVNKLSEGLTKDLTDGCIYLLHDSGENPGADEDAPAVMIQALRKFLDEAMSEGYRIVPLEEMKKTNR